MCEVTCASAMIDMVWTDHDVGIVSVYDLYLSNSVEVIM